MNDRVTYRDGQKCTVVETDEETAVREAAAAEAKAAEEAGSGAGEAGGADSPTPPHSKRRK